MTRLVALLVLLGAAPAAAQQPDEPLLAELASRFKTRAFSVNALLQVVGDVQESRLTGRDGFTIANMRLGIGGQLDGGFSYFIQANFVNSPALLDARMSYAPASQLRFDVGRFKAPFSAELLTGAASIDFVNRARVVSDLAPGRQIGLQAVAGIAEHINLRAGMFTGPANNSRTDSWLAAARADYARAGFQFGVNAALGANDGIMRPVASADSSHDGTLVGADVRFTRGRLLLASELIYGWHHPDGTGTRHTWGTHATAGWRTSARTQVLARWDRYEPLATGPDDQLILGFNLWPTTATEVQVNTVSPLTSGAPGHQLLVNFQVGF